MGPMSRVHHVLRQDLTPMRKSQKNIILLAGLSAGLLFSTSAFSFGGIISPGVAGIPIDVAANSPSCGQCHTPSAAANPKVTTTADKYVVNKGELVTLTTTASGGGVSGTTGGFAVELGGIGAASNGGSLVPGPGQALTAGGKSLSHMTNSSRSWTFSYRAGNALGLVEIFTVAMTSNGTGQSGDEYAFHGFNPDAPLGTPVRILVVADGVANTGPGCTDGYGNQSSLGTEVPPTLGNMFFGVGIYGASPTPLALTGPNAVLFAGVPPNSPGFTMTDLTSCNAAGYFSYIENPVPIVATFTTGSPSNPEFGDAIAFFPLPIPNDTALAGMQVDLQCVNLDPFVQSSGLRTAPIAVTNGLRLTISN